MNVRDLSITLRPRSGFEALDLGTALAKRYYGDFFRMGLVGFGPFMLLAAILCWFFPWLLIVLIWWLKPIFDRFYLYYLSRRIFGAEVSVKETWGKWRTLFLKGFFPLVVWRRFSFNRAMLLAVTELEGLSGAERSARCSVLARVGGVQGFLATVGGLVLEVLGMASLFVLAYFFIPQGQNPGGDSFWPWLLRGGIGPTFVWLLSGLAYGFFVILLEPIYLGSGFGLYLNSRTSQEAWDIELRFRELAARVAKTRVVAGAEGKELEPAEGVGPAREGGKTKFKFAGTQTMKGVLLFAGILSLLGGVGSSSAEEAPQEVIEEVLSDEAFEIHTRIVKERVRKERDSSLELPNSGLLAGGLNALFGLLGVFALALLVGALVVVLVNILKGRSLKTKLADKPIAKRPPPQVVMGMQVTPESLPADLLAQARLRWSQGQAKLALSLLYRGALSKLIVEQGVAIEGSDTERECLRHVQLASPGGLANYFQRLSSQWVKVAYSHEEVLPQDFEQLCATWPFERGTR